MADRDGIRHGSAQAYQRLHCHCTICRGWNADRARHARANPTTAGTRLQLRHVPFPGAWSRQGACHGRWVDVSFFTYRPAEVEAAQAICETCPVLYECRLYALDHPALQGIWGGLTEKDRRHIIRQIGIARRTPEPLIA